MTKLKTQISFAHSPDCDDAFMFYGIASGMVDTGDFAVAQLTKDIETLNNEAKQGKYEITAISFASYPSIADQYMLMPCGGSFGLDYGPVIVAKEDIKAENFGHTKIAIPGYMTTAYLLLRLYADSVNVVVMPFQDIIPAVLNDEVDAGLLIHEGQITYQQMGLKKIIDLGQWWHATTNLPLPLGGNAVKRDLGKEKIAYLTKVVCDSIKYALSNHHDALKYAMGFAGDMPESLVDRYVRMYVNDLSVDCGDAGKKAVKKLFELAVQKQVINSEFNPPFM